MIEQKNYTIRFATLTLMRCDGAGQIIASSVVQEKESLSHAP
jgi:hypothetical protein